MSEFKRGDVVWCASYSPERVQRTCPICFGKKTVRVILGDESIVETPCDYCGNGFEGPRGYIEEYETEPRAVSEVIASVIVTDGEVRRVEYRFSGGYHYESEDIFTEEAAALNRAREKKVAHDASAAEQSDRGRRYAAQKISWSIGYHMAEAKRARESAAYHSARAVVLKGREVSR